MASSVEKPLETSKLKKEIMQWVEKWDDVIDRIDATRLGKKWFYTTNRRKKMKITFRSQ